MIAKEKSVSYINADIDADYSSLQQRNKQCGSNKYR